MWAIVEDDCCAYMATLADCSIDSIVTDPPYELGFMGRKWDSTGIAFNVDMWRECLRVLKPGGHLITFGGQRTIHRIICAAEDAGFDVRDLGAWQYWSGFPKSLDVSKAIDKAAGAEREIVGYGDTGRASSVQPMSMGAAGANDTRAITAPATDDAKAWQGWGTALKPCLEPWALLRKPFKGTVAANVLKWGTGGLNIDGCRYAYGDEAWPGPNDAVGPRATGGWQDSYVGGTLRKPISTLDPGARWPANVYVCPKPSTAEREIGLHAGNMLCSCKPEELQKWANEDRNQSTRAAKDSQAQTAITGSQEAAGLSCSTDGHGNNTTGRSQRDTISTTSTATSPTTGSKTSRASTARRTSESTADAPAKAGSGSSRVRGAEKAKRLARSIGISAQRGGRCTADVGHATSKPSSAASGVAECLLCGRFCTPPGAANVTDREGGSAGMNNPRAGAGRTAKTRWCVHPTVKPIALMQWLCRLVTKPGGTVFDPFAGSGTTGIAAMREGFSFIGVEMDPTHCEIARCRIRGDAPLLNTMQEDHGASLPF